MPSLPNSPKKVYPPEIRAISFDADGCLFHEDYIYSLEKDVIAANIALLTQITNENDNFNKTITFVGSNRQSWAVDLTNHGPKGSCFPAIKKISEHLGAEFDTFLLADIYGGLTAGTSYDRAMEGIDKIAKGEHKDLDFNNVGSVYFHIMMNQKGHAEWAFDETKATILYAQMHKIAQLYKTKNIVFEFYDDRGKGHRRGDKDILEHLHAFFSTYPELIPINVTLRLKHYAGGDVSPFETIEGQGSIDLNFCQTVKDMAAIAKPHAGLGKPLSTAHHVEPHALINRIEIPAAKIQYGIMFSEELKEIQNKAKSLRSRGYCKAADTADKLYEDLTQYLNDYQLNKITSDEFKENCNYEINVSARPVLEVHRDWKEFFLHLALFIASAGIGYIIGITYNKIAHGRFQPIFFKTDSVARLDIMGEVVNGIGCENQGPC